jgi:leader peptidase (prepilin peptidase)/N-methyltransferase
VVELFAEHPLFCYAAVVLFGLIVGSFLNVVILRLPRMMQAEWRASAAEILGQPTTVGASSRVTLSQPPSTCGHCSTPIKPWQNIPVISFLMLRGRCGTCGHPISLQYPAIEILSALIAIAVVARFGMTPFTGFALIFSWTLLTAAMIDWQTQFLPDSLSLPLLWLGLLISLGQANGFALVDPATAIVGAAAGYLVLWAVFHAFLLATGKEGMGYGDFKLLAVIGAWLGWQALPMVLLMSSVAGAIVGGLLMATGVLARGKPMPFGPWLALAGWLTLVAGDTIGGAYASLAGFS